MIEITDEMKKKWLNYVRESISETENKIDENITTKLNGKIINIYTCGKINKSYKIKNKNEKDINNELKFLNENIVFFTSNKEIENEDKKEIEKEINKNIFKHLINKLIDYISNEIQEKRLDDCKILYDQSSSELLFQKLGIICQYWILYLLNKKGNDGHCYVHPKPCQKSKKFHSDLFEESFNIFKDISKIDFKIDNEKFG